MIGLASNNVKEDSITAKWVTGEKECEIPPINNGVALNVNCFIIHGFRLLDYLLRDLKEVRYALHDFSKSWMFFFFNYLLLFKFICLSYYLFLDILIYDDIAVLPRYHSVAALNIFWISWDTWWQLGDGDHEASAGPSLSAAWTGRSDDSVVVSTQRDHRLSD